MRAFFILIGIMAFSDLFSQTDLVRIKNYDKDSKFIGYKYIKSDSAICSSTYDTIQNREIYWRVDKKPLFGDSIQDILNYIQRNIIYPDTELDISGRVFVRFVVEVNGKISNIAILRGIDPLFDKQAIEVIKNMPEWQAGECNGKKVPVYFTVPVKFALY